MLVCTKHSHALASVHIQLKAHTISVHISMTHRCWFTILTFDSGAENVRTNVHI